MTTPTLEISINGRPIGTGHPPYVIAEVSANHNGAIERAHALIQAAKDAGADAVKLQTYTADTLTIDSDRPEFIIGEGPWEGRSLYDLYLEAAMPWEWHAPLFAQGRDLGITVFSSPFDKTAIELLESLDAPAYKIASSELIDIPLIEQAAKTGKPLILSTGMATSDEIQEAVDAARAAGGGGLAVLHCIAGYPTPPEQMNLSLIQRIADMTDAVTGLSDHSLGCEVAIAAIAMGAAVIEKHFTLSRSDGGADAAFSLEPQEMKELCDKAALVHSARGTGDFVRTNLENTSLANRRSLYVVADIAKGEIFNENNVRSIRPGLGMAPKYYPEVLGKRAKADIKRGTPLYETDIEPMD